MAMLHFFTPLVYEKIYSFLRFSGGVELEYWSEMGYQNNPVNISFPFLKSTHMEITKLRVGALHNAVKFYNLIYEARKEIILVLRPVLHIIPYLTPPPNPSLFLIAMPSFFPFVNLITLRNKGDQAMSKFL